MGTLNSALSVIEQGGEESRPLIAALSAAVYTPDILASVPWRDVQSARSSHRVLVFDDRDIVVAAAGLIIREASFDGNLVQIGGVGGVMTMPARQGTGIGRIVMEAVAGMMARFPDMQFGMLFCEPKNITFYKKLGWRNFEGVVEVEQDSGKLVYDVMQAMVRPVHGEAPACGRLDVRGLPW